MRLFALVALSMLVGCTSAPATPDARATSTPPPQPTARALSIVLRMHHVGGHLYPGTSLDVAPAFTLYGNGEVIYRPSDVSLFEPSGRGGGLRRALMNEEQKAALLDFALGPGGLAEAGETYSDVPVADSLTTRFEMNEAGLSKVVSVYALDDEVVGREAAHRQRFKLLARLLGSFEAEVRRGNATDAGEFEPVAYSVSLFPDEFAEFAASADWPWTELTLDDFARDRSGFGVLQLSAAEAEPLFDLPPADIGDPIVVGPDEVNYLVRYRPLLPDELD